MAGLPASSVIGPQARTARMRRMRLRVLATSAGCGRTLRISVGTVSCLGGLLKLTMPSKPPSMPRPVKTSPSLTQSSCSVRPSRPSASFQVKIGWPFTPDAMMKAYVDVTPVDSCRRR